MLQCISEGHHPFEKTSIKVVKQMTGHELEQCILEYGKDIYSFCRYLARSPQETDDLYQDVFLTAVRQREKINYTDNPKSYLLSVALRIWKNKKRKSAWRKRIADMESLTEYTPMESQSSLPSPEDHVVDGETRRMVRRAVEELPERLRIPVLLYYMESLPVTRIGEILKLPRGTVLSRLHQARKLLKKELENVYDEEKS